MLICENELYILPNKKVSAAEDHGKNYMRDRPPLVRHLLIMVYQCMFQILGGCQGRRTGAGMTTVFNSLMLGGWVTQGLKNGDEK